jgi:hypothetical protein
MSAALATANIPSVKATINAFINLLFFTVLPPLLLADPCLEQKVLTTISPRLANQHPGTVIILPSRG